MPTRYYTAPDGTRYPLSEARHNNSFKVYKSDRRKAKPGDPHGCWIALGIRRDRTVLDVYISSGKDAYVIYKGIDGEGPVAVHFVIRTSMRRLIDAFDKDRTAKTMEVKLFRPPAGLTLAHRRKSNKRRAAEIKAGATKKPRGKIAQKRITRIGVGSRPRARISESGSVSMQQTEAA